MVAGPERSTWRRLPSVSELDLSWNAIRRLEANGAFGGGSTALLRLDLSENAIEAVPSSTFRHLSNLRRLDLGRNRLVRVQRHAFEQLVSLETLRLEHNDMVSLDGDAFQGPTTRYTPHTERILDRMTFDGHATLSLRQLNLSANRLERWSDAGLRHLVSLETLDVSGNRLRRVDAASLRRLGRLVELRVDANRLCRIDDGALRHQPKLRRLSLRDNQVGPSQSTTWPSSSSTFIGVALIAGADPEPSGAGRRRPPPLALGCRRQPVALRLPPALVEPAVVVERHIHQRRNRPISSPLMFPNTKLVLGKLTERQPGNNSRQPDKPDPTRYDVDP